MAVQNHAPRSAGPQTRYEVRVPVRNVVFQHTDWRSLPQGDPATLAIVNPTWKYTQQFGAGNATADPFKLKQLTPAEIMAELDEMAETRMAPNSRILMWVPIPQLWNLNGWAPKGFKYKTGGAWVKSREGDEGHYGQGYHWAGCAEFIAMFARGAPPNSRKVKLRNGWVAPPSGGARKPTDWLEQMINRWTAPEDTVFDPWAGLAPTITACVRTGRKCLAAEPNKKRYEAGLELVAEGL